MLNILLCSSDNSRFSGAFLCMVDLCKYFQNRDDINVLVILPYKGSGTELLKEANIPFKLVRSYSWATAINSTRFQKVKNFVKCILNIKAIWQLIAIIHNFNIDIVHSNTSWTYVGMVAGILGKVKTVWHLREVMWLSQGVRPFLPYRIVKAIYDRADALVSVSKYVLSQYPVPRNEKALICIYDGVDVNRFLKTNRSLFLDKKVNIVMVNSIYPGKRQGELIEALTKLPQKIRDNINVRIAGYKDEMSDYVRNLHRTISQNGLENVVNIDDAVKEVEKIYCNADISVVCSPYEAFGRVAIESLLSGCCVIGCSSGATSELIENLETGLLYESGNAKDLADKILFV